MPTLFNLDTHQNESIRVELLDYQIDSPLSFVTSTNPSLYNTLSTTAVVTNNNNSSTYWSDNSADSTTSSNDTAILLNLDENKKQNTKMNPPNVEILQPPQQPIIMNMNNMSPLSDHSDASAVQKMQNLNLVTSGTPTVNEYNQPYLRITEQPVDKFRFRYKSEMHGTHGSLIGATTSKTKKSFPSVILEGYDGPAIIRCSLYQTKLDNLCLHSHSLVVRRDNEDCRDPHDVEVSSVQGYTAVFQGMGIIHTAKKFIVSELYDKLQQQNEFLKSRQNTELESNRLKVLAEIEAKNMNLNQVRLCFEAFKEVGDSYEAICDPVLSNPINNMKSALTGELKITRLSACVADADGSTELFLFVEKVGKKNIKVRFYEMDDFDEIVWQDYGQFTEADVHHQYAIALRTPPYRNKDIDTYVNVLVQLYRPSDGCESVPVEFKYKPRNCLITRKRARYSSACNSAEVLPSVIDHHNDEFNVPLSIATPQLQSQFQDHEPTISKEYNKSEVINHCLMEVPESNSLNLQSGDLAGFLQLCNKNSDEYMNKMFNSEDLKDFMQIEGKLVTDGVSNGTVHNSSNNSSTNNGGGDAEIKKHSKLDNIIKILPDFVNRLIIQVDDYVTKHSNAAAGQFLNKFFQDEHNNKRNYLHNAIPDFEETSIKLLNLIDLFKLYNLLDLQNDQKETALHIAVAFVKTEITKELLDLGADPNLADNNGNTPLHNAVIEEQEALISVLLNNSNLKSRRKPCNIDLFNDDGQTALHLAVGKSNQFTVRRLINAGASQELVENKTGNTILHSAVLQNSSEMILYILSNTKVEPMQQNIAQHSALDLALLASPFNEHLTTILIEACQGKLTQKQIDLFQSKLMKREEEQQELSSIASSLSPQQHQSYTDIIPKIEIKEEIVDNFDTTMETHLTSSKEEINVKPDAICLNELCQIFNQSDRWIRLAEEMKYKEFIDVWKLSKNPSRTLLNFSEVQGTKLHHLINVFRMLNIKEALTCIDAMIARQMDDDSDFD